MSAWLYSIVGIVFLSVLIDILYPNGKTNNFSKSIFGIMAVIVMIKPILNLKKTDIDDNNYINVNLATSIKTSKDNINILIIEQALKNKGISGISVEIDSIMQNNEYEVENILVDVSNVVLNENMEHTYMYKVILETIVETISIDDKKVIIYG